MTKHQPSNLRLPAHQAGSHQGENSGMMSGKNWFIDVNIVESEDSINLYLWVSIINPKHQFQSKIAAFSFQYIRIRTITYTRPSKIAYQLRNPIASCSLFHRRINVALIEFFLPDFAIHPDDMCHLLSSVFFLALLLQQLFPTFI